VTINCYTREYIEFPANLNVVSGDILAEVETEVVFWNPKDFYPATARPTKDNRLWTETDAPNEYWDPEFIPTAY
jgi:hypothetical protein